MSPRIGEQDEFEGIYTEKFRVFARPHGEFVKYERDRAAIDIGLHLTQATRQRFRSVAHARVWFQLKGIRSSTLPLEKFRSLSHVPLDLDVTDLKFWYASPETVYLGVYIEAADMFLAEDIRDVVGRRWGETIFSPETFKPGQKTARVAVSCRAKLDSDAWQRMLTHRSLRIDGPSFRGRPLGHRLDPLRCYLARMEPKVFSEVVGALLSAHGYRTTEDLDPAILFPAAHTSGDVISLTKGTFHHTYEWVLQMMTEFTFDEASDFRIEGEPFHAQGPCAVVIHSNKASLPAPEAIRTFAQSLAAEETKQLLVFVNDRMDCGYFGNFNAGTRGTGVRCVPQHLGDLSFNLLTATNVYLEFRHKISWEGVNFLY